MLPRFPVKSRGNFSPDPDGRYAIAYKVAPHFSCARQDGARIAARARPSETMTAATVPIVQNDLR
jgi:hypothetical protein